MSACLKEKLFYSRGGVTFSDYDCCSRPLQMLISHKSIKRGFDCALGTEDHDLVNCPRKSRNHLL